jgi:hypothetical protein
MEIDSGGEGKKMPNHQIQDLITQIKVGAVAYVRNLAVAEDAVQKGQFWQTKRIKETYLR